MTPPLPQRIYRMFRRELGPAPSVRGAIIAMVLAAVAVTGFAIAQVSRRHEVVRLGYALSKASTRVREAEERHRRLELERATLAAPERIRGLAQSLGMIPTQPDQTRVIAPPRAPQAAVADAPGRPEAKPR